MENQLNEDLGKINEYLDNFESTIGLNNEINAKTIEAAQEYLNTDWFVLKTKNCEELALASCILTDYSGILQRVINREKAIISWATQRIRKLIGHLMPLEKAYSFEERENLALQKHPFGNQLHQKKTEAEMRLARIEGLNFTTKNMADKLESLAKIKVKLLKYQVNHEKHN